jgi:CheY-like chemotaxis protein
VTKSNPPTSPAAPASGGHVLVVDDDPTVRELARRMLAALRYDVAVAASGADALAAVARDPARFQLVLLDLTMPGLTGVDTRRNWRPSGRGCR